MRIKSKGFVLAIVLVVSCLLACNIMYASGTFAKKGNVQWAFTQQDQHPEKLLVQQIDSAKNTLDIAIYSLTYDEIVNAIIRAKDRNVQVRIITDKEQSQNKYEKTELNLLKKKGVKIKYNKHSGLQHMKMTIVDNKIATTGSYNYSKGASTENDEILVAINDADIASEWDKVFQSMWDNQKGFATF